MNVNSLIAMDYEIFIPLAEQKNKPNSNPIKPNLRKVKMNVNSLITKDYRKKDYFSVRINKPNFRNGQNERKLNFNKGLQKKRLFSSPKNKPNQSQFKACPERSRMGQFLQKPKSLSKKSGHTLLWIYLNLFLTPPGQTVKVPPSNCEPALFKKICFFDFLK